jgi:20S proteasome alpha/beta subunit
MNGNAEARLTFSSSYHAEPSGTFYRYDAKAIGSGSEGAQAELVNEYHKYVAPFISFYSSAVLIYHTGA